MMQRIRFSRLPIELLCWVAALMLLYFSNPGVHHFTLCPLENLGFDWCPGCGLGRSIALFMHGEVAASIAMHGLGIPAFLVLSYRIYSLAKLNTHLINRKNAYEQS